MEYFKCITEIIILNVLIFSSQMWNIHQCSYWMQYDEISQIFGTPLLHSKKSSIKLCH